MAFGLNPETGRPGPTPRPGRDGDKLQARSRVNFEVKRGDRPHPNELPCVDCGHVWRGNGNRHEYDHHKGYDAEHHYDVVPVCRRCHTKRDNLKAKQTHCGSGHEFTPENTYQKANGTRACRECMRRWERERVRKYPPGHWTRENRRRRSWRG